MSQQPPAPGPTPNLAALQEKYPFHKRYLRKDVPLRVEVERASEALTSSQVNITPSGICYVLDQPFENHEEMRTLLYLPRGKEMEILKLETRVVWQEPIGEAFRIAAGYIKFAPGDERRLRQWFIDLDRSTGKKAT